MKTKTLVTLATLFVHQLPGFFAQGEVRIVEAAHMLDVESGKMVSPAIIVVEGDRIQSVNPERLPDGVESIDLGEMTLLPGLMDMHTHLTIDIDSAGDWIYQPVKETAADWALRGARNARLTLLAGFTTVRDVGSFRGLPDIALMRAIDSGLVDGPRMFPAGHAISITGGHCDITGFAPGVLEGGPEEGIADGVDEVLKAVRYQIKHGAKVIKVCATAGVLSFEGPVGAPQYSVEELRAVVEEAERHGLKVATHAHGTEGIINALRAGVHSIDHGSILNEEAIRLLKETGAYLVMNLYLNEALDISSLPVVLQEKEKYLQPLVEKSFQMAIKSGVNMAFGTDAAVFPHGDNAMEFAAQVDRGMAAIESIRGATLYAADLLGVDDRGLISKGRLADIIAVESSPLEDITTLQSVRFVMKGGVVYKQP